MTTRRTEADKQEIVKEYLNSPLTITQFCNDESRKPKVSSQSLLAWLEKDGYRMTKGDALLEKYVALLRKYEPEEYRKRFQ